MKNIITHIRKTAFGLGLVIGLTFVHPASAATISLQTQVPGVNGWVLVRPELRSQLGGRVVWDGTIGSYVTDRVARGEAMRITVSPTPGESTALNSAKYAIWCGSKNSYLRSGSVTLRFVDSGFVVPRDTSLENLFVQAATNLGFFELRIPIGNRP